jgi:hypothetical protein
MVQGVPFQVAVGYERFVSHFSVYNRFDIREAGLKSSNATESKMRSGVVRHASLQAPASIFLSKRENR